MTDDDEGLNVPVRRYEERHVRPLRVLGVAALTALLIAGVISLLLW